MITISEKYMIDSFLKLWAIDEAVKGNRVKANRIMKVKDRRSIKYFVQTEGR